MAKKRKDITIDAFEKDGLKRCTMEEVYDKQSIFGNDFFLLTDDDIEALKNGSVLYFVEEYGLFLAYGGDKDD